MAGPGQIDNIEIVRLDQTVEMDIDEVQSGRRTPVPEQPWFDMIERQRLFQQRIVE